MFSPSALHRYPVASTRVLRVLPFEPVCEKKLFATISCEWASLDCVNGALQVSAAAGPNLPPVRQSAPAARSALMRTRAALAKSLMPQVEPVVAAGAGTAGEGAG